MNRSFSARCGHVNRRLLSGERLTGKVLELALEVVGEPHGQDGLSAMGREIANKLKLGHTLTDYELHIMVDVLLLHARLGGG